MGEVLKNKTTFSLTDDLSNFFSLPEIEEEKEDYSELKEKIYSLKDIDYEEKASILNLISKLSTSKADYEKNKIIKEINLFRDKYNI